MRIGHPQPASAPDRGRTPPLRFASGSTRADYVAAIAQGGRSNPRQYWCMSMTAATPETLALRGLLDARREEFQAVR
jgi:hypothetical protein